MTRYNDTTSPTSGEDDLSDVTTMFPHFPVDDVTTPSPRIIHSLGILPSKSLPLSEAKSILTSLEDENITFSGVRLQELPDDDVIAIKTCLRALRALKPSAIIGPYSSTYAIATEHLRIPYFVTSLTPASQSETPYLIQLFPSAHALARASVDMLSYYQLKRVAVIYDCEAGEIILERLAREPWLLVTGYHVTNSSVGGVREQLKVMRNMYYTTFILVLTPGRTRYVLDQALSLSMFSKPNKWFLINVGLQEYDLDKYADSHANVTVLRLMMDYNSSFCGLGENISLSRAAFHDAVRLYVHMYTTHALRLSMVGTGERVSMRRTVRKLRMDGCTGHLMFSRFGIRSESFLQLMTLQGYNLDCSSGTWRSRPADVSKRVEPSKSYSTVASLSGNVFGDRPLRITVLMIPPFVQNKTEKKRYDAGHPHFEGFCIDILLEMAKILGFQYNVSIVPDGKFGSKKPLPRGWTGMVRQLIDNKADVALAPFQMSTERAEVVDFTKPFMTKGTTVVVRRPEQKIGIFQFLSPLSNVVWGAIFVAFVGVSLMLFAVSRVNSDRQTRYTSNLSESFWYIWGTLLRGSLTGSPHAISSRIVSSAWWFFCLIISSIYTANLAAFLTITISDVGINTAGDLAAQKIFDYGTVEGSQTELFFKHTGMQLYSRMWAHMSVLSPKSMSRTVDIGFERVKKGKYAFIWDSPTIRHTISNDCDLMEIGSPFDLKGYGFAYRKNAPYGEKLSMAILKLNDEGILYRLERKWWRPQNCPNQKQSAKTKSLDLETVAGMYVVILLGALISSVLCLLQYFIRAIRRKKSGKSASSSENGRHTDRLSDRQSDRDRPGQEPKSLFSSFSDAQERSAGNQDEITNANHSPLQYRSVADWT
ncbi:glutamate receptor subunit protein GluR6 [Aplysia californica]|uniref:Glutamate receptor subunit protein GluR6 n=1 Tax=Aplysia californica TaxID=6500 RepID=Q7Z1H4_APLCA|nr:glutamate receptor subunit protein GluR6 [Aplysia californica]AAP41208.1 glutamate receptor subunit protein GluR6 [Aplysia californica]